MKEQYRLELIQQIGEIEKKSPQVLKIFLDRNTREDLILKYQKRAKIMKIIYCILAILAVVVLIFRRDFLVISVMLLYISLSITLRVEILKRKINLYKLLLALEKEE